MRFFKLNEKAVKQMSDNIFDEKNLDKSSLKDNQSSANLFIGSLAEPKTFTYVSEIMCFHRTKSFSKKDLRRCQILL